MNRSSSCYALILRVRSCGESNREVTYLCAEEGIRSATLFGGPKSKLRAHVAPFHSGLLWIYRDPAKEFRKVSDFDVKDWRPGLRELFERSAAASAVAETILAGHGGGGSWGEALSLTRRTLDALDTAFEKQCLRIFTVFLWRWAEVLGLRPDVENCAACESPSDGVLWFVRGEGLLCSRCAAVEGRHGVPVGAGARNWLRMVGRAATGVESAGFETSLNRVSLDDVSLGEAKTLATLLMEDALGRHLSSWDF